MKQGWNTGRFALAGLVLGATATQTEMLFHPTSILAVHAPILITILGGLLGTIVLGGAAISHNRFQDSMSKFN